MRLLALGATLALLAAVASAALTGCISSFDLTKDYFPNAFSGDAFAIPFGQTVVTTATDFSVQYNNYYKIAQDNVSNLTYILYQCGAPKPSNAYPTNRFFSIPLPGFSIDSTVLVPFIQMLGAAGRIREAYIPTVSPCIQKLIKAGKIVSFDSKNPYNLLNPIIDAQILSAPYPLNAITFSAASDPGPLKRAEWVKYLALFFNQEERATQVYDSISKSYACLNGSASQASDVPTVAWLSYYEGIWTASNASYKMQYVSDATGANPGLESLTDYDMSKSDNVTAFHNLLKTVDIVIDETYLMAGPPSYNIAAFKANAGIKKEQEASFPFLSTPNVWSIYGRHTGAPDFSTDWYESALAQPQLVLQDMLTILHPDVMSSAPAPYFFYNVAKGDTSVTVTADACTTDPTAAVDPVSVYCPPSSNTNSVGAKAASHTTGSTILAAAAAGLVVASAAAVLL